MERALGHHFMQICVHMWVHFDATTLTRPFFHPPRDLPQPWCHTRHWKIAGSYYNSPFPRNRFFEVVHYEIGLRFKLFRLLFIKLCLIVKYIFKCTQYPATTKYLFYCRLFERLERDFFSQQKLKASVV